MGDDHCGSVKQWRANDIVDCGPDVGRCQIGVDLPGEAQQDGTKARYVAFEKAKDALNPLAFRKVAAHDPFGKLVAELRLIDADHLADVADQRVLYTRDEPRGP
jgi:hypothetical protein